MPVRCDEGVQERAKHHGHHEGREDVSQRKGYRVVRGLLEGRHPDENEEVHRALEDRLSET